ncbi:SAM-dependent methyltransferase [Petrotoga sp. 9PWA.NaAc.5.4]|nr:methyltransferase [Petrotoga sp. 9PWA.NaAc.5.4]PNR94572.1 SAM-dependent methyltransferase [Petrotoga sp. 9PWA.NaAc.5.4]
MVNSKKENKKYEDVQIYGPDEIAGLNIEEVIEKVSKELISSKSKQKNRPNIEFEHYYTENPTSELIVRNLSLRLKNGHQYIFKAPSGVYGKKRIDKASILLIENVKLTNEKVLDIGCGYGVIGITLKKEFPGINLYMSDINIRAVDFSKINSKNNNVEAVIKQGNLFEPWEHEMFEIIVSNPPIVAGKEVLKTLIKDSKEHLNSNGKLFLVAYHNKGGSSLELHMKEVFGNVIELEKSGGIRVYMSIKRD